MKTFAVDPTAHCPTLIIHDGNSVTREEFKSKKAADKRILALIKAGHTFDNQAPKAAEGNEG